MLSFGAFPAEVPARVRFLHPLHNFALVSYDPHQLSEEVGGCEGQPPAELVLPALLLGDALRCSLGVVLAWACAPPHLHRLSTCSCRCRPAASSARCTWRPRRLCVAGTPLSWSACPSERELSQLAVCCWGCLRAAWSLLLHRGDRVELPA